MNDDFLITVDSNNDGCSYVVTVNTYIENVGCIALVAGKNRGWTLGMAETVVKGLEELFDK